jgi:hypothetical protein
MPAKIRFMVKNSQPNFLRLMMRNRAGSISSTVRQRIARVKMEFELPSPETDFSMEFNGTEFVQSSEVVPGIDPADGAGTGAHS